MVHGTRSPYFLWMRGVFHLRFCGSAWFIYIILSTSSKWVGWSNMWCYSYMYRKIRFRIMKWRPDITNYFRSFSIIQCRLKCNLWLKTLPWNGSWSFKSRWWTINMLLKWNILYNFIIQQWQIMVTHMQILLMVHPTLPLLTDYFFIIQCSHFNIT